LEDLPAGEGSGCEGMCQTGDDGMSEAPFGHALFNLENMIA
jgi:hypothetical protein